MDLFTMTLWPCLFLAAAFAGMALLFSYGLMPAIRLERRAGECGRGQEDGLCPKLSVVMYCRSGEETLLNTLEAVCRQDYPDFEVIVVCDAGLEYAGYVRDMVTERFDRVYVTFVQPGSHNLSRRKLANTIGIKAAKGDVVLTTVANISVPSDHWLSEMMHPFRGADGENVDVALGTSVIDFSEMRGPGKWYRQFDALLDYVSWAGYAAASDPYRGDGFNLAFRRKVFFDHKGYSKTMFLENGDDDLFLREIAEGGDTRLVLSPDARLTTCWGDSSDRVWGLRKAAYSFTARWLPRGPFVRAGIADMLQWLVPGLCVAAALTGLPSLLPLIIAAVMVITMWGVEIYLYRRMAAALGRVRLWWGVVPFWLWRPAANFLFNMKHFASRKKNFTWQR